MVFMFLRQEKAEKNLEKKVKIRKEAKEKDGKNITSSLATARMKARWKFLRKNMYFLTSLARIAAIILFKEKIILFFLARSGQQQAHSRAHLIFMIRRVFRFFIVEQWWCCLVLEKEMRFCKSVVSNEFLIRNEIAKLKYCHWMGGYKKGSFCRLDCAEFQIKIWFKITLKNDVKSHLKQYKTLFLWFFKQFSISTPVKTSLELYFPTKSSLQLPITVKC